MLRTHVPALLLSIVLAVALAACDRGSEASAAEAAAPTEETGAAELARVEFAVAGMDCPGCAVAARTVLRRLDGVEDAGAEFSTVEASTAWAVYDPENVTPERMIEAIGELGYTATVSAEGR